MQKTEVSVAVKWLQEPLHTDLVPAAWGLRGRTACNGWNQLTTQTWGKCEKWWKNTCFTMFHVNAMAMFQKSCSKCLPIKSMIHHDSRFLLSAGVFLAPWPCEWRSGRAAHLHWSVWTRHWNSGACEVRNPSKSEKKCRMIFGMFLFLLRLLLFDLNWRCNKNCGSVNNSLCFCQNSRSSVGRTASRWVVIGRDVEPGWCSSLRSTWSWATMRLSCLEVYSQIRYGIWVDKRTKYTGIGQTITAKREPTVYTINIPGEDRVRQQGCESDNTYARVRPPESENADARVRQPRRASQTTNTPESDNTRLYLTFRVWGGVGGGIRGVQGKMEFEVLKK